MGYDMSFVHPDDPTLVEELRAERDVFLGGPLTITDGNRDQFLRAVERLDDARGYFRLNIWGMQVARAAMAGFGMVHDRMDAPDWPETPAGYRWPEERDEPTPAELAHDERLDRVLRASVENPGIPAHKLCSNDGWVVTPIECLSAVKAWEEAGSQVPSHEGEPVEWWSDWIDYLRAAALHGGFEVW